MERLGQIVSIAIDCCWVTPQPWDAAIVVTYVRHGIPYDTYVVTLKSIHYDVIKGYTAAGEKI